MISPFLLFFFILCVWIVGINQLYGWKNGRLTVMRAIPSYINQIGEKLGYDFSFDGQAWNSDIPLYMRLFITLIAILRFLFFPFGVDTE